MRRSDHGIVRGCRYEKIERGFINLACGVCSDEMACDVHGGPAHDGVFTLKVSELATEILLKPIGTVAGEVAERLGCRAADFIVLRV